MHEKIFCKNLSPFEICDMCVERRYLLNFRSIKFCFEEMPEKIKNHVVTLENYFKKITKYDSFFYWSNSNILRSSLDNPCYDNMEEIAKVGN